MNIVWGAERAFPAQNDPVAHRRWHRAPPECLYREAGFAPLSSSPTIPLRLLPELAAGTPLESALWSEMIGEHITPAQPIPHPRAVAVRQLTSSRRGRHNLIWRVGSLEIVVADLAEDAELVRPI